MWLLPAFSIIARLLLRVYYRLRIAGAAVPRSGPVLLVANHPNALLDPAAVVAAARRPVRFLAKAPLFADPRVGWLVRGAGALPVYRRADDATLVARNQDTFSAVYEALRAGAAVGIFPEGISHDEPSLAPLKTGAARIALGAADGRAFPLVPVGLSLRAKERFRSEALVLVGEPIEWDDLAARGGDDATAVRALTERIDGALRGVTVNLQRWEDAPLLEAAREIYLAEAGVRTSPEGRLRGMREVAEGLARLRGSEREWAALAAEVRRHARLLRALGLRPDQLAQPRAADALRWSTRNALLFLTTAPVALLGALVFYLPYRLTGRLARLARPTRDARATYTLLIGVVVYPLWVLALAAGAAAWRGPWAGIAALLVLPALALATLLILELRRSAEGALRRFLVRRRRAAVLPELRTRQRQLAARLAELRAELGG